jgi:predicted small lipoprotein YifL
MRPAIAIIVMSAGVLTGACGIKGPLYLPNAPKDATWPIKTDKPAPPAPPAGSGSASQQPAPAPDPKP